MSAQAGWIDFRALCKSVSFSQVLHLYKVELKIKRDQAQGFCPLPGHNGQRRSPSFSVNVAKGIWQCFGCGRKGNVIDFVGYMEGLDPLKGKDVRRAAEILQEKLGISSTPAPPKPKDRPAAHTDSERSPHPIPATSKANVVMNAPLDFALKNLDQEHPYLLHRGFTPETIRTFGLGCCNRGMLQGRIAIPIHDGKGELVAYAGRLR